jgi:hypothetical protein
MTTKDTLEKSIARAVQLIQGGKNYLNLSDEEITVAYRYTRLDNYAFTNYMTKLCRRSPGSIRAMLSRHGEYRMAKKA